MASQKCKIVPRGPNWKVALGTLLLTLDFANKLDHRGHVVSNKAHFVAHGLTQTPCVDFFDAYSATAKLWTLKMIVAGSIGLNLHLNYMVTSKNIFTRQIKKRFTCCGRWVTTGVFSGINQLTCNWIECLSSFLNDLNFKASVHDPCLLTLTRNGHNCLIVIWLEDIVNGLTEAHLNKRFIQTWANDLSEKMAHWPASGALLSNGAVAQRISVARTLWLADSLREYVREQTKADSTWLIDHRELTRRTKFSETRLSSSGSRNNEVLLEAVYWLSDQTWQWQLDCCQAS